MRDIIFQSSIPKRDKITLTPKEFEDGQRNDENFNVLLHKTADIALNIFNQPGLILEFGAGTGLFSKVYVPNYQNSKIVISEPDEDFLKTIPSKFPRNDNILYVQALAEEFHWQDKFDVILGSEAYHHVPDQNKRKLFTNFHNLLKDHGYLIIGDNFIPDYNPKNPEDRINALHKFLDPYIKEKIKTGDLGGVRSFQYALKQAESGVMEYKTSLEVFENYSKEAGFVIVRKEELSNDIKNSGGYCIYVLQK